MFRPIVIIGIALMLTNCKTTTAEGITDFEAAKIRQMVTHYCRAITTMGGGRDVIDTRSAQNDIWIYGLEKDGDIWSSYMAFQGVSGTITFNAATGRFMSCKG